ncbi:MAG: hypothetical protein NZM25_02810 [Leptospiraceae bacterium]|nr:hypothetical protein [Leptospiraceae bacterium]MDW8307199.1 hypothetical protein [Leptospiraceae bacterium]
MKGHVFFIGLFLVGCAAYIEEPHVNPLDTLYDDGDFRIVLAPPRPTSDGRYVIGWSNVFHEKKGELKSADFAISPTSALRSRLGKPTIQDIEAIRQNQVPPGFTQILTFITAKNNSYAGEWDLGVLSPGTRSYILSLNYNYPAEKKSGILHSNVVVFEP